MAKIWADRLIAGTRTWSEVPDTRKTAVKEELEKIAAAGGKDAERAKEILDEIGE